MPDDAVPAGAGSVSDHPVQAIIRATADAFSSRADPSTPLGMTTERPMMLREAMAHYHTALDILVDVVSLSAIESCQGMAGGSSGWRSWKTADRGVVMSERDGPSGQRALLDRTEFYARNRE